MRIPTIHQQRFGDLNKQLNRMRAQMNKEVREKYVQLLEKKKEN